MDVSYPIEGGRKKLHSQILCGCLVFYAAVSVCYAQNSSNALQDLYAKAKAAEASGQLNQAAEVYKQIVRLAPGLPAAHNNLGRVYYQQGQYAQAIPELERACRLDATLEPPRAVMGFAYYQLRKFDQAREQLRTAVRLSPKDRMARLYLARSEVELGNLKSAEQQLEALREQDPADPEVLYTLGNVYSSLAKTTIGAIQSAHPDSYLIKVLLAKAAEARGSYTDAAALYKQAIELQPQNSDLYYQYGHALWANKQEDAALGAYRQALALNAYDYRASWEAARIVLDQDPKEAVRLVTDALNLEANLPEALKIRGEALLALQNAQEAIADLTKSVSLDAQDPTTHFQLARAYRQAGLFEEAKREDAIFSQLQNADRAPSGP